MDPPTILPCELESYIDEFLDNIHTAYRALMHMKGSGQKHKPPWWPYMNFAFMSSK